jgi:hypothetical protein
MLLPLALVRRSPALEAPHLSRGRVSRPAKRAVLFGALLSTSWVACHGAGPYGHSRVYVPTSAEQRAAPAGMEYDAFVFERAPDKLKGKMVWLFGVVTQRRPGPGGAAHVALSLRTLQQRNLCESDDEDTCRVTVSEREMGRAHALLVLSAEDEIGELSVGLGSLVRVVGRVAEQVDSGDGTGVVRADFYRHWPRGSYVTTKAASVMHR